MIERVYRRVSRARRLSAVVVLTDDDRIANAVRGFGGDVEMTPTECASGTDRIAYAARSWEADVILNVQGDEPLIEPASLEALAEHLIGNPQDPVATLAFPADTEDLGTPDTVKVVTNLDGYALYFSRAPIPYPRNPGAATVLRHIGVYGYQRQALVDIAGHEPTPLEQTESLEQLRMLESGLSIKVLLARQAWPGVDTMDDLQRMEELLRERPELADLKGGD
jgi:3-deoxy-manno-octulosonate cytidylyltransferase (CMP-KDO synthetase)